MSKKSTKYTLSVKEKLFLKFGTPIIAFVAKLFCISCRRVPCSNEQTIKEVIAVNKGCIYSVWHQRMFYFAFHLRKQKITIMISRSKDGEIANSIAEHFGYQSVRGSKTKGGHTAMAALIKKLNNGSHMAGMMVDGPTGPPRKVKMGAIKIARETGKPIIPLVYGANNKIVVKSWDRFLIPKPFSKIVTLYGDPVFVPENADKDECEQIRQALELKMNEMADLCDHRCGHEPVGKPGFDLPAA